MKKEDTVLLNLGENTLLVSTFWSNYHFGPYFDFATILAPKNKKSILFWSLSSTHKQKTPTWQTEHIRVKPTHLNNIKLILCLP